MYKDSEFTEMKVLKEKQIALMDVRGYIPKRA